MAKMIMREGKLFLRETVKGQSGEVSEAEGSRTIQMEEVIEAPTASAGCSRGMKISKNYQSADVTCWVTLPCKPDDKEIKDTLKMASEYVDEHLAELVKTATKDLISIAG